MTTGLTSAGAAGQHIRTSRAGHVRNLTSPVAPPSHLILIWRPVDSFGGNYLSRNVTDREIINKVLSSLPSHYQE